jgi:signal transduction histidine kinase
MVSGNWPEINTAAGPSGAGGRQPGLEARSSPGVIRDPAKAPSSLTARITLTVIVCQLVLTLALTVAAVLYAREELGRAFDTALNGWSINTLAAVRYNEDEPPTLLFDPALMPVASDPVHPDLFEIRLSDGRVLAHSDVAVPPSATRDNEALTDFSLGEIPYRAVILRQVSVLDREENITVPDRVTVIYAASLVGLHRHLTELGASVAGTSLLLLFIASAFAAWGVRRGLAPLHELAAQASVISVRNWDFRPPPDSLLLRELAPLTRAIETVLDRLRDSFRQQRDFTSDAAHELKTCVAIVKSTLQSLLQRPRPEQEYRVGLESLLEDCGRLEDLLARLLRLERIEQWAESGMMHRELGSTEVTSTCEAAVSRIQALAGARNIHIELLHPEEIHLKADPEDLELIWVNLLENALRYSPSGSAVVIRVERNDGNAVVSVQDSGPGITAEQLPYIFERFYRGDPSRSRSTGGFGLGLAICKAMVTAYGGEIQAVNRPGQGTEIRVRLPAEAS